MTKHKYLMQISNYENATIYEEQSHKLSEYIVKSES